MSKETSPLLTLIEKLRKHSPPSISILIAKLNDIEDYRDFLKLIRDYVPEHETEILREETPAHQIGQFCSRFEDRYFPLEHSFTNGWNEDLGYSDLTRAIPLIIRGMSWDDYDSLASGEYSDGYTLMAYLLENPYEPGHPRLALAEACSKIVSKELIERVPDEGFSLADIRRMFKDSKYDPIVEWCEHICQDTGNFFLDTDWEMHSYNYPAEEWDKGLVESLTEDWQQAERIDEEISNFSAWIEENPGDNFKEILDFVYDFIRNERR